MKCFSVIWLVLSELTTVVQLIICLMSHRQVEVDWRVDEIFLSTIHTPLPCCLGRRSHSLKQDTGGCKYSFSLHKRQNIWCNSVSSCRGLGGRHMKQVLFVQFNIACPVPWVVVQGFRLKHGNSPLESASVTSREWRGGNCPQFILLINIGTGRIRGNARGGPVSSWGGECW